MNEIIKHFIAMQKQSERSLGTTEDPREELGDWHRGLYCGERQAYGHCIKYLSLHLTSRFTLTAKVRMFFRRLLNRVRFSGK